MDTFYTHENRLTDGSVIWEVWQRGSEQRLASAATEDNALGLVVVLNATVEGWASLTPHNTVDA